MFDLKFSYNWNNKLDCTAFTTIRLFNSSKHKPEEKVNLLLKENPMGTGTIKSVRCFFLADLNEFVSYLDTGYSVAECQKIIHTMYPQVDFTKTHLALILIVKDKKEEKQTEQLPLFKATA